MSFIGIITNPKNEQYMKNILNKENKSSQIIFITDKNIENMKNIRFETVVVDSLIKDIKNLKFIISNAKYIILNADLVMNFNLLDNLNLIVISYGFNNKSTFTVSSVSDSNIIICLQRIIYNIFGEKYEPQEFVIEMGENIDIYAIICAQIIVLIYQKIPIFETNFYKKW